MTQQYTVYIGVLNVARCMYVCTTAYTRTSEANANRSTVTLVHTYVVRINVHIKSIYMYVRRSYPI